MKFVGSITDDEWLEACREQNYSPDVYDPDVVAKNEEYCKENSLPCNLYHYYNRYKNDRSIPKYDMCASLKEYAQGNWWPILELNIKSRVNSIIFKIFYIFFRLRITVFKDLSEIKFYRNGIYWSDSAIRQ